MEPEAPIGLHYTRRRSPHIGTALLAGLLLAGSALAATALPEWTQRIRQDHPRLFFNRTTWPQVRARALGAERAWYGKLETEVAALLARRTDLGPSTAEDLGVEAAKAAFVFLMTEDPRHLDLARRCMAASLRHYEACFAQRQPVNWQARSRVHAIMAWDWLHDHLDDAVRGDYLSRFVRVLDGVIHAQPPILRENLGDYRSGFYGIKNCLWFIACAGFGTGVATEKIDEWLVWGHDENLRLLEFRRAACGDDGGGSTAALGYVLGAYPWSEQNFFYTWLSSTGQNIATDWPHSALLPHYFLWNWISANPRPLTHGWGDVHHTDNLLPLHRELPTHIANIRHLFGHTAPQAADLAQHVLGLMRNQGHSTNWFIYPFLWTGLAPSQQAFTPAALPKGRHFEGMGQTFLRSGTGTEDTYCLFTCGGVITHHRHYDALNFVIYHRGFLALDSGTRQDEFVNGAHLANYYAQTVAHNCVVIHQPGEPPAQYWGGEVTGNHGGQHKKLGSIVRAFETHDDYVYVAGDGTAAYRHGAQATADGRPLGEKCTEVTRQLVFIPPHHFVIFDRVGATDPAYRKDWLLHTAQQPVIQDRTFRADQGEGRLFCQTLLPADARLTAVGGEGKEFWAAGKNWSIDAPALKPHQRDLIGRWRVEVTPGAARADDVFLHVIQVGSKDLARMDEATRVETDARAGVRLQIRGETWQVAFNRKGPLGGRIARIGRERNLDRELTDRVTPQVGVLAREYPGMTAAEARARIPARPLPDFWIGDLAGLEERLRHVKTAKVEELARSPGGRPIRLVAYGAAEAGPSRANFNSAIGGQAPAAYRDKSARKKPVILLVGPVHGQEVEGLTGLLNLIAVMETGRDLRGRDQTELQTLGRQCRLLIIPLGNPDGLARFEPRSLHGMSTADLRYWGQGTWSDGTFCGWRESKRQHPMTGPNVGFLGAYFNDAGVNPMHDEFFAPMSTEAPAILKLARDAAPDLAVSLHSHEGAPALLRPAFVPLEVQERVAALAQHYNQSLAEQKLPHAQLFKPQPEGGRRPAAFNLTSAVYHVSGATPFTFESPHGLADAASCHMSFDQILDLQLALYASMFRFELQRKQL